MEYSVHGRNNLYKPLISQTEYGKKSVNQLIKGYFDGSPARLVSQFISDQKLSEAANWNNLLQTEFNPVKKSTEAMICLLIYIMKTTCSSYLRICSCLDITGSFSGTGFFMALTAFSCLAIPVFSFLLSRPFISTCRISGIQPAGASPIRLLGVGRGTFEEAFTIYGARQNRCSVNLGIHMPDDFSGDQLYSCLSALYASIRFLQQASKNKTHPSPCRKPPCILFPKKERLFLFLNPFSGERKWI